MNPTSTILISVPLPEIFRQAFWHFCFRVPYSQKLSCDNKGEIAIYFQQHLPGDEVGARSQCLERGKTAKGILKIIISKFYVIKPYCHLNVSSSFYKTLKTIVFQPKRLRLKERYCWNRPQIACKSISNNINSITNPLSIISNSLIHRKARNV